MPLPILLLLAATTLLAGAEATIVCVGDSITFGDKIERGKDTYPKALERLFGGQAKVLNAGHCGAAAMQAADLPYRTTREFTAALAAKPQVVVIMLGTNDARQVNWGAHHDDFAHDLADLVATFRALPGMPAVWLCLPPPAYATRYGIQPAVIRDEIHAQVAAVAKQAGIGTIDVFTALADHPELFADGIHPNAAGAAVVARTVHAALSAQH